MKELALSLALALAACGPCLPKSLTTPASASLTEPPARDVAVARSADELRAAAPGAGAFAAGTDFRAFDVAVIRAGEARQVFAGADAGGGRVTLYYSAFCPPCAGGNPGSYDEAAARDASRSAARTDLVRVPKGARVAVKVCDETCRACPTDVP